MLSHLRPALVVTAVFTLLTGVAYPLAVTGVAKLMPGPAEGSLLKNSSGTVVGSALIGQAFAKPGYLHGRPSAAGTNGYDASASSGSNLGPLNADLVKRTVDAAAAVRADTGQARVPEDAVTTSGSGLDPHISPIYAKLQAPRIAKARGADVAAVQAIIAQETDQPFLGFIGQPAVNVLKVNLALDAKLATAQPSAR